MSHDDSLVVQCTCGCTTILKRNGYNNCSLDDALYLGKEAGELCGKKAPYPWGKVKSSLLRVIVYGLVLMLLPLYMFIAARNVREENVSALGRARMSYMLRDYKSAVFEVRTVLDRDPSNLAALVSISTIRHAEDRRD